MYLNNKIMDYKIKKFILFSFFFIFCIFTRVGFWNTIIVEGQWDETTYLLAGREILKGKIPYLDFWEIKTIYVFIPYYLASFFSDPILTIRIFACLSIFFSSLILYTQSEKIFGSFIATNVVIFFLSLNSIVDYQSAGITIFLYPLLLIISYIILSNNNKNKFQLGLCCALVVLMRPNFYPLVFFLFIIIAKYESWDLKKLAKFLLGGTLPVIIAILPYLFIKNGIEIIYKSLFLNLLAAGGHIDWLWQTREVIRYLFDDFLGVIFIIITYLSFKFKNYIKNNNFKKINLLFYSSVISVAIVFTGIYQFNNFFPYLSLCLGGVLFSFKDNLQKKGILFNDNFKNSLNLIIFFILMPVLLKNSIYIIKNYNFFTLNNKKIYSYNKEDTDKNKILINELKKVIKENEKIFAYDHFIYLMLNKEMPSNIIHPTIFTRLGVYKNIPNVKSSGSEELNRILENKPDWIILRSDFLIKQSPLPEDFMKNVKEKYYLFGKIQGQYNQSIFRKK